MLYKYIVTILCDKFTQFSHIFCVIKRYRQRMNWLWCHISDVSYTSSTIFYVTIYICLYAGYAVGPL